MQRHLSKIPFPHLHSLPSLGFMFTSGLVDSPQEEQDNQLKLHRIARQVLGRDGRDRLAMIGLDVNQYASVFGIVCAVL